MEVIGLSEKKYEVGKVFGKLNLIIDRYTSDDSRRWL